MKNLVRTLCFAAVFIGLQFQTRAYGNEPIYTSGDSGKTGHASSGGSTSSSSGGHDTSGSSSLNGWEGDGGSSSSRYTSSSGDSSSGGGHRDRQGTYSGGHGTMGPIVESLASVANDIQGGTTGSAEFSAEHPNKPHVSPPEQGGGNGALLAAFVSALLIMFMIFDDNAQPARQVHEHQL